MLRFRTKLLRAAKHPRPLCRQQLHRSQQPAANGGRHRRLDGQRAPLPEQHPRRMHLPAALQQPVNDADTARRMGHRRAAGAEPVPLLSTAAGRKRSVPLRPAARGCRLRCRILHRADVLYDLGTQERRPAERTVFPRPRHLRGYGQYALPALHLYGRNLRRRHLPRRTRLEPSAPQYRHRALSSRRKPPHRWQAPTPPPALSTLCSLATTPTP